MVISIPERIRTLESYDPVARKRSQTYIRVSLFEFEYILIFHLRCNSSSTGKQP